jgi:hypothetical protein
MGSFDWVAASLREEATALRITLAAVVAEKVLSQAQPEAILRWIPSL